MIEIYYICIIENVHFCPLLSIPYPKSECGQNKKWTKVDVDPPPPLLFKMQNRVKSLIIEHNRVTHEKPAAIKTFVSLLFHVNNQNAGTRHECVIVNCKESLRRIKCENGKFAKTSFYWRCQNTIFLKVQIRP